MHEAIREWAASTMKKEYIDAGVYDENQTWAQMYCNKQGIEVKVQNFDLKDQFIEQGQVDELRNRYGLESHQITNEILNRMKDGKKDE